MTGDKKRVSANEHSPIHLFPLLLSFSALEMEEKKLFLLTLLLLLFGERDLSTSLFGKGEVTRLPLAYFSPFSSSSSSFPPGGGGGKRRRGWPFAISLLLLSF